MKVDKTKGKGNVWIKINRFFQVLIFL